MSDIAYAVPLVERLRSVDKNCQTSYAIQWAEDGTETGHHFVPVGCMMYEAADEIERLQVELTKAQELAKSRTIGHLYEQELEKNKRLEAELTCLREQEPVGIVQTVSIVGTPMQDSRGVEWLKSVPVGAKLYTHPAPIPDGWKLVPVEPTEEGNINVVYK